MAISTYEERPVPDVLTGKITSLQQVNGTWLIWFDGQEAYCCTHDALGMPNGCPTYTYAYTSIIMAGQITPGDHYGNQVNIWGALGQLTLNQLAVQHKAHIIYVNGQYRGADPIGSIMYDFFCADPKDMNNEILADEVAKYKDTDKGVNSMCRIVEELTDESLKEGMAKGRTEGRVEGRLTMLPENVKKLMARGMSFDEVADTLELSKDDRKFVQDNL